MNDCQSTMKICPSNIWLGPWTPRSEALVDMDLLAFIGEFCDTIL